MELKQSYHIDLFNNYFTTTEFDFINRSDLESQKLDDMINKENETIDIIKKFISNLNDLINNKKDSQSNLEYIDLLNEVQNVFEKVDTNIKTIYSLKQDFSIISDLILNLLVKIESNPNDQKKYIDEIQNLKDKINNFSFENEKVMSKVFLNNISVESFFKKDIVKKYLTMFDININLTKDYSATNKEDIPFIKEISFEIPNKEIVDNNTLLVSEKAKKVFLPYTQAEISLYLEQYPNEYKSSKDVINKEFVLPLDYYIKHPVIARFREAYSLIRDRESKSIIDAFKFALDIMFHYELNPVIIAACKTQDQLENYMICLEKNKLNEFTDFVIKFEITPLA